MPPKKSKRLLNPELDEGTLHVEWFPAYGIRIREMPHITVVGADEAKALQSLAQLGFYERRDRGIDYNMVFLNEPFEVE